MDAGSFVNVTSVFVSALALGISVFFAFRQLALAKTSNGTLIVLELIAREFMNNDLQESHNYVLTQLVSEHKPDKGTSGLPLAARRHLSRVCWFYSSLSHFMISGAIDERLILSMVGNRARTVWYVVEPYIRAERAIRKTTLFAYFEHLAYLAATIDTADLHRALGLRAFDFSIPPDCRLFPREGGPPSTVSRSDP